MATARPTSRSITELKDVLLEEINLYQKYAEYLQGDSDLMVQLKTEELEESNKSKATLLLKIKAVEEARQKLVSRIAQEKGIQEERVRITDICKTCTDEESKTLLALRERLQTVIQAIRVIQDDAQMLVKSSLRWIDGSMNNLKHLLDPSGVYNKQGVVGRPQTFQGTVVENKA